MRKHRAVESYERDFRSLLVLVESSSVAFEPYIATNKTNSLKIEIRS